MLKRVLRWLLSFLPKKKDPLDLYQPRERLLYKLWDGEKLVPWDPLVLYKRLRTKGADISVDIKVAASPLKDAAAAHDNLLKNIRWVFQIKPYEGGGLTETECLELLEHFWEFVDTVKKNSRTWRTSPAETSPSSPSSSDASPPTSSSSPSGSCVDVPPTETPSPSPSEPGSPLELSNPDSNTLSP